MRGLSVIAILVMFGTSSASFADNSYSDCVAALKPDYKKSDPMLIFPDGVDAVFAIKKTPEGDAIFKCPVVGGFGKGEYSSFDLGAGRRVNVTKPMEFSGLYIPNQRGAFGDAVKTDKPGLSDPQAWFARPEPFKVSCARAQGTDKDFKKVIDFELEKIGLASVNRLRSDLEYRKTLASNLLFDEKELARNTDMMVQALMGEELKHEGDSVRTTLASTLKWLEKHPEIQGPDRDKLVNQITGEMQKGRGQPTQPNGTLEALKMTGKLVQWLVMPKSIIMDLQINDAVKALREREAKQLKVYQDNLNYLIAHYESTQKDFKEALEKPLPEIELTPKVRAKLDVCAKAPGFAGTVDKIVKAYPNLTPEVQVAPETPAAE